MSEQVHFQVEQPADPRDRGKAVLRPILAFPHALLVGGPIFGINAGGCRVGVLGLLAMTIAVFDWVAILFTGHPVAGLQPLKRLYLQWRARVLAYSCFLRDEYPPFGDASYPAYLELPDEPPVRDRLTVALRPFLVVPHLFVLIAILLVELVVWVVSWLTLSIDGRLAEGLWRFSRNAIVYVLRVEAYALLVHDTYPAFKFSPDGEPSATLNPTSPATS